MNLKQILQPFYGHEVKMYLRIMKLTWFLIFALTLQTSASLWSQTTKMDIDLRNTTLLELFTQIENNSQYRFFYSNDEVDVKQRVTVKANDDAIGEILTEAFKELPYSFKELRNNMILVEVKKETGELSIQQQKSVSGKVVDEKGEPLPGVTVVLKGTATGVITDFEGNFNLTNVSGDAILVFSFVGMRSQEISVGNKTVFDIVMVADAIGVDEVVVIGYGTQKKSNLTAAVEMVDTEVLENRPVRTVGEMLQGTVPNLNITTKSGAPDATPDFNIRGFTGLNTSAQPLILVDGVEQDINLVNANDIESISVLKDAAATAIYGSRAPFGVILIKTKSGQKGQKMQINYSGNINIDKPTYIWDIENSLDWAYDVNNKRYNSQQGAAYSQATIDGIIANRDGTGEVNVRRASDNKWDWHWGATNYQQNRLDLAYKDMAINHSHDINIQGGSDRTTYYVGLGYFKKEGIYESDFDFSDKYTMAAKINTDITDFLSVRANMRFGRQDATRPNYRAGSSFSSDAGIIGNGNMYYFPNVPSINPDGNYHWLSILPAVKGLTGTFSSEKGDLVLSTGFDFTPLKGLMVKGDLSYTESNSFLKRDTKHFKTDWGDGVLSNTGRSDRFDEVQEVFSKLQGHTLDLSATYSKQINKHDFLVMAGYQQDTRKFNRLLGRNRDLYSQDVMALSTSYGENPSVGDVIWHWATRGYFFRASYNFDGKYLIDFNGRYDATSKYSAQSRWAFFPSVSVGYNVAKENFWSIDKINTLKITGSWGKSGDQNIDLNGDGSYTSSNREIYPYISTLGTFSKTNYVLNGGQVPYVTQPGLISSSLTWAKPETYGIGLEIGAFDNRLQTEYRWYQRTIHDQTGPPDTYPEVLGTDPPLSNNAVTETRGWELSVAWKDKAFDLMGSPLRYNVRAVLSDYIGYVVDYPSNVTGKRTGTWTPGEEFGVLYGYKGQEVIRDEQRLMTDMLWRSGWNYTGSTYIPDVNGDGRINSGDGGFWYSMGDQTNLGYRYPRYKYSFLLGASWKAFDVSVFLDGVGKQVYHSGSAIFIGNAAGGYISHALQEHHDLGYYSENNQDAFYPRTFMNSSGIQASDTYLMNMAHLRIKNVNLTYTLPQQVVSKLKLKYVKVNFSGENLGFIYNKLRLDMDPIQVQQNGRTYPIMQVYSLGVKIGL